MHAWQDFTERAQLQMLFLFNSDFPPPMAFPSLPPDPFPLDSLHLPLALAALPLLPVPLYPFSFKLLLSGFDISLQSYKQSGDYGPPSSAGYTAC